MTDANFHKEHVARKLILLREQKKWSQTQVANKLKIPRTRYAQYELRRSIVPHAVIETLCEVYEITMDDFKKIKIPVHVIHNVK